MVRSTVLPRRPGGRSTPGDGVVGGSGTVAGRPVFVCASTHPGEDGVVVAVHRALRAEGYRVGAVNSWVEALTFTIPGFFLAAVTLL